MTSDQLQEIINKLEMASEILYSVFDTVQGSETLPKEIIEQSYEVNIEDIDKMRLNVKKILKNKELLG